MDLIDAFDLLTHADALRARLLAAFNELSRKQGLKPEKQWLGEAIELMTGATDTVGDLATRALALPELEPVREDFARTLQAAAVDAVERLEAGLTFHGGKRSPLLEALYAKLKLPALRRAPRKDFEKFATDFEKRLNGTYVKRMLGDAGLDFARTAVAQVRASLQAYRSTFSPAPLSDADAQSLEQELRAAATRLEIPSRQARLVAEAALAPVKGAFEASGLGQKPKRRAPRAASANATADEAAPDTAGADAADGDTASATDTGESDEAASHGSAAGDASAGGQRRARKSGTSARPEVKLAVAPEPKARAKKRKAS